MSHFSWAFFTSSILTETTRRIIMKLHHARDKLRALELPRREKQGKTQRNKNENSTSTALDARRTINDFKILRENDTLPRIQ